MRISDWSSDVCSSDLLDAMGGALHAILDVTIVYPDGPCTMADLIAGRVRNIRVYVRQLPIDAGLRGKNGRASCRERVCQYVLISVVSVSLKKNNKYNHTHL